MSGAKQKKAGFGKASVGPKSGQFPNWPQSENEMVLRYGISGGNNAYPGTGIPFFGFLEQIVVQVVRNVLDAQKEKTSPENSRPLRDISTCEVIRPRDLPQVCGLSRTTCWRLSKDPASGFPPKIRLSSGAVGYSKISILRWLQAREES